MPRGDGKNPKFRILCKRCNSYQHTHVNVWASAMIGGRSRLEIKCVKCGNTAESFEEENRLGEHETL